jgi:acyl dehydratase
MLELFFENYAIGDTRKCVGRTVTEADIVLHAGQTGDFYPQHMDAEWCALQPFKQRIAHGTLTFALAVGQTAALVNPRAMTYGYDCLRFIRPVFIGNTLTTHVVISDKRDHKRSTHGIVVEKLEVKNQRQETVLACEHLLLVERINSL